MPCRSEIWSNRDSRFKKIPLLRALKTAAKRTTEFSVYFDTDKHKLHRKGLMLRVRRIGYRHVQTIKATRNSELFERNEWETEIASEKPELELARGTALEPFLSDKFLQRLKPMFETRVERTVYSLTNGTGAIALTLDRGKVDTGARSAPLCEIEIELKRGNQKDLFHVARELTRAVPTRLAFKSKSARGYELLDDEQDAAVKAAPFELIAGWSTRRGFKTIGRTCLKQIVGNEPALLLGDPEGVHQLRVGLRRLRAAMSLFADILSDPQTAAIKTELKWLTGELGPAREFEVLMKRIVTPVKERHRGADGVSSLSQEVGAKRDAALARAQDAVKSARFRALMLDIAAWLETGDWMKPRDNLVRDLGRLPIEASAAQQMSRRWRKIRRKGRAVARLEPP